MLDMTVIYRLSLHLRDPRERGSNNEKVNTMKIYTLQSNKFGNLIVCGDEVERKTYRIIFTGSYADCMARKYSGVKVGA